MDRFSRDSNRPGDQKNLIGTGCRNSPIGLVPYRGGKRAKVQLIMIN